MSRIHEGSPVIMGPPGSVSGASGKHAYTARRASPDAGGVVVRGRNVFEELGPDFALLAFDAPDAAVKAFMDAAASLKIPLKVIRDDFRGERERYESRLILVRPDHYVVVGRQRVAAGPTQDHGTRGWQKCLTCS